MEIGPFISNLLFSNEKVVLPNFGEFSTRYIPARFLPEEKKIEAPRKQIDFNPLVKQGKPILAQYISSVAGLDFGMVEGKIETFVGEVYSSLDQGKKVKFDQVGMFMKGFEGEIVFEPDKSINYLSDTIGLGSVSTPNISQPIKPIAEPSPVKHEPVQEQTPVKAEPVSEQPPVKYEPVIEQPVKTGESPENVKKKRKMGWLWFLIALLVIVVAVYFLLPTILNLLEEPKPTVEQVVEPKPIFEPEPEPEPVTDPFEVKPFIPERGVPAYFIVIGAFSDLSLAEEKARELRDAGGIYARPFMITQTGFHRVSYGYYHDIEEAEANLVRVREMGYHDAYIFRHTPR